MWCFNINYVAQCAAYKLPFHWFDTLCWCMIVFFVGFTFTQHNIFYKMEHSSLTFILYVLLGLAFTFPTPDFF